MNKITFIALLFALPLISTAQKKTFTFDQIFRGQYPSIYKPLPQIAGWIDDDHYIEVHTDDNDNETAVVVDVLTGKTTPYVHPKTSESEVPEFADAQNITLSPDGKYAAYTRKNNLYITELASKKETAITSDGKDGILNGYAQCLMLR